MLYLWGLSQHIADKSLRTMNIHASRSALLFVFYQLLQQS